ncbi:hypothetical protein ACFL38_02310 [Candidatus Omnitrophota bacterium]
MKRIFVGLIAVVFVLCMAQCAFAQSTLHRALVTVHDSVTGEVIEGATVIAVSKADNCVIRTLDTDSSGVAWINSHYQMKIRAYKRGYAATPRDTYITPIQYPTNALHHLIVLTPINSGTVYGRSLNPMVYDDYTNLPIAGAVVVGVMENDEVAFVGRTFAHGVYVPIDPDSNIRVYADAYYSLPVSTETINIGGLLYYKVLLTSPFAIPEDDPVIGLPQLNDKK